MDQMPVYKLSQAEINEKANALQNRINKAQCQKIMRERTLQLQLNDNKLVMEQVKREAD